ncbi:MAG TPA: MFS transporter [Acidocella sp.]|jgi:predicted MFS family arabinose efflux permease|nr:MFS transporter [Acidocella sp.]
MLPSIIVPAKAMRTHIHDAAALRRSAVISAIAFLTLVDLFATQAILPMLATAYRVPPAAIGVAVNACTLGMAISGLGVALTGNRLGRRAGIIASLVVLSVPTALLASAHSLAEFALLRVAQGLCMSTAFTLTLAYLGESCSAKASAGAFAAYITGNVASNLIGRIMAAGLASHFGLATNFRAFALLNLAGALLAAVTLHRTPREEQPEESRMPPFVAALAHLRAPALWPAFAIGFCILFAFIGLFTYVNFVLVRPPLGLGMMAVGLSYLAFLPSVLTTPLAGRLAGKVGTRRALQASLALAGAGLALVLAPNLVLVVAGMVLVACGTFFAQGVATGYVGRTASMARSAASGLYLAFYFTGGLVGSFLLGQVFDRLGWTACVVGVAASLLAAALLSTRLRDPQADPERPGSIPGGIDHAHHA